MINSPDPRALAEIRYTVLAVAFLMAAATLHQIYVSLDGRPINAVVAALLITGIVGITRKVRWGRRIAVAFFWGSIIISFGALSPFNAGDLMAEGIEPPSILTLGLRFAGVCAIAIVCLHYLGKHKSMFRPAWI
jgi:hypothetical protein